MYSYQVYCLCGPASGDPSGNRTRNLPIKRYLGLSAVLPWGRTRAKRVLFSCEKFALFHCESTGQKEVKEGVSFRCRSGAVGR